MFVKRAASIVLLFLILLSVAFAQEGNETGATDFEDELAELRQQITDLQTQVSGLEEEIDSFERIRREFDTVKGHVDELRLEKYAEDRDIYLAQLNATERLRAEERIREMERVKAEKYAIDRPERTEQVKSEEFELLPRENADAEQFGARAILEGVIKDVIGFATGTLDFLSVVEQSAIFALESVVKTVVTNPTPGSTRITTIYEYEGNQSAEELTLIFDIPKVFAESADDIEVTSDATIEVLESDPVFAVTFSDVNPNEKLEIQFETQRVVDPAALAANLTKPVVIAKGLSFFSPLANPANVKPVSPLHVPIAEIFTGVGDTIGAIATETSELDIDTRGDDTFFLITIITSFFAFIAFTMFILKKVLID